jgi:hypothetical protein
MTPSLMPLLDLSYREIKAFGVTHQFPTRNFASSDFQSVRHFLELPTARGICPLWRSKLCSIGNAIRYFRRKNTVGLRYSGRVQRNILRRSKANADDRRRRYRALFGFCGFAVRRAAVIVTTSASHLASGVSLSVKGMPFSVEAIPIGPHCVADRVL